MGFTVYPKILVFPVKLANILMFTVSGESTVKCLNILIQELKAVNKFCPTL